MSKNTEYYSHVIKYGSVKYFMKHEIILSRRAFCVISYSTMRIHMFMGNLDNNIYNIYIYYYR